MVRHRVGYTAHRATTGAIKPRDVDAAEFRASPPGLVRPHGVRTSLAPAPMPPIVQPTRAPNAPQPGPVVCLHDLIGVGVIVLWPTGVRYTNQTGGTSCLQPEAEGFFVPLRNDLALNPVELLGPEPALCEYFIGPTHRGGGATSGLDAHDVSVLSQILHAHGLDGILEVDESRLADSHEAWVYVRILRDDCVPGPSFSGLAPYPRSGILTWPNSD